MHPSASSARVDLQQHIARTAEFLQELQRTSRAVQKQHSNVKRCAVGLRSKRTCVLVRMIADQNSMKPHAVLASRRLLPGDVWLGAGTLAEQAAFLRAMIGKPMVRVAGARALAVVLWKGIAVKAVRIIAELRILKCIAEMNSKGVTPNSKMVAEMLVQQWPAHVHQPHVKEWLSRLPNEAKLRRRWLVKLRRFWGVHYRKLGSRRQQSPADEKRKEQTGNTPSEWISGTSFDPTTGGQNGAIQVTVGLHKMK